MRRHMYEGLYSYFRFLKLIIHGSIIIYHTYYWYHYAIILTVAILSLPAN